MGGGGRGWEQEILFPDPHGCLCCYGLEQALTFNCHDLVKHVKEREEGSGGIWGYGEGEKEREGVFKFGVNQIKIGACTLWLAMFFLYCS